LISQEEHCEFYTGVGAAADTSCDSLDKDRQECGGEPYASYTKLHPYVASDRMYLEAIPKHRLFDVRARSAYSNICKTGFSNLYVSLGRNNPWTQALRDLTQQRERGAVLDAASYDGLVSRLIERSLFKLSTQ